MFSTAFPTLQLALASLSLPHLLIDSRVIADGDEFALLEEEAASLSARSSEARRASGAARIVARDLIDRLGFCPCALPKGPTGSPMWPSGVTGSLTHDERIAVAAVGNSRIVGGVGIDLESIAPLTPDMMNLVITMQEREKIANDPTQGKLLFATKEAVYKALHPLDGIFLEFNDIEVDIAGHKAITGNGRVVEIRFAVAVDRIVALALA